MKPLSKEEFNKFSTLTADLDHKKKKLELIEADKQRAKKILSSLCSYINNSSNTTAIYSHKIIRI